MCRRRRSCADRRLRADYATYLETLLLARGSDARPLLLLDIDAVSKTTRNTIAEYGVPQLTPAREALAVVEGSRADAVSLLERLADLRKKLLQSPK